MNRRQFIGAMAAAVASTTVAVAEQQCSLPDWQGVQACEAGINSSLIHIPAIRSGIQQQSQWCWAACISMVFGYYGHDVPQQEIVQRVWGNIVNMPAGPTAIMQSLNNVWRDTSGRQFRVWGDAYNANPATASQDLANNMPLIIGTQGHAMVLTSLTFVRDGRGNGQVTNAIVRDPWPGNGRRALTAEEWYGANLLARVRVI